LLLLAATASAQGGAARTPLLMPGKKALYQRVLTRPGAALASSPGGAAQGAIPAFTRYYVYDRKTISGAEWLEVGADSYGAVKGWLEASQAVPWRQQLALAFTPPGMRQPVLFFKDRKPLADILDQQEPGRQAAAIRKALASQGHEPRIVAVEPPTSVDINKKFYLLPILEAEEVYSAKGPTVRLLEVASVAEDTAKGTGAANGQGQQTALKTFSAAVVFVIDSTVSMGPYIDRTRQAVRRIYDKVQAAGLSEQVRFGLVAFRAVGADGKRIDYVTREYVDPAEVESGEEFLSRIRDLKPATASTSAFDEDSYAGVMAALQGIDWPQFGARYVVLVTDAGALEADDQHSQTGLSGRELRLEAQRRGVAIYALHLLTAAGKADHDKARAQYEALSESDILHKPLYYPVQAGSVDQFGRIVDALADSITAQVQRAARGEKVPGSAQNAAPDYGDKPLQDPAAQVRADAERLGYAMRLAWLGKTAGVAAPEVFRAWIADRDLADPTRASVEVRVLLSKAQLSDLQMAVKAVADAALKGVVSPDQFFAQLSASAAAFSRNPDIAKGRKRVADLGLTGEWLEELPYRSDILKLDDETWRAMGAGEQEALIRSLNRKLRLYAVYNADADRWVSLAEGADPSEAVYPVPLDALP
jgi:hypothetical protein